MSKIEVDEIVPRTGNDLTVGSSGQTIIIPSGATFNASNSTFTLPDGSVVAAKIATGAITADKISSSIDLSSKTVTLPASAVTAHVTPFDDNKIVNDLSTLALRQASDNDKAAYSTNSSFVDVFQDDTGIDTETNTDRNANEYVSAVTQVADSSVAFLLNQDTASGSTTFTDATGNHTITSGGNPTWSNTQAKWGSNSIHLDGNDYLQLADSDDWYYGSSGNGWTFEAWWYAVSTFHDGYIWYQGTDSSNGNPRNHLYLSSDTQVQWYDYTANVSIVQTVPSFTNNWRHIALVFDDSANQIQVAIDGTWQGSATSYTTPSNNSNPVKIGRGQNSSAVTRYLNGYLDGLKISKKKVYTLGTNFTAPTSQFTATEEGVSATGNFTGTTITADSSVSSMGAIITYQDQAGTNALNTDIVLQLSADGGSNYSTATLTAMPDFSTGIKMAKVNDLAVTAGTSLKYKISFANQASGTKEARIRGVSLQY